jgi:hypothetical protein
MTKQNPSKPKEQYDVIIQAIMGKEQLKTPCNVAEVKSELNSLPKNFTKKLDKVCDELADKEA